MTHWSALWDEAEAREKALAFDPKRLDPDYLDNPYPWYHALRDFDPVHRCPDGSWFLTRHADVAGIYRDRRMSSDKTREFAPKFGDGPLYTHHTTSLVFNDPPRHTRVRKLIQDAFTPRALAALQPRIEALVDDLLDRAEEAGSMDLVEDFAFALPVEVISDILGVPRADRAPLRDFSLKILGALEPVISDAQLAAGNAAVAEFGGYLDGLIRHRRAHPSDDETDILNAMVHGEVDGERLTHEELVQNCIFLLNAGHETTTNLVGNGIAALLDNPSELQDLRANPDLIRSAIEEFLRFESSNQLGNRRVTETAEIGGVDMAEGDYIHLCIGGANRDPDAFPEPDRLDIRRQPNRHLAFGGGIHICIGNTLARMEGAVAVGRLVSRFPGLRRDGAFERGNRARFRGFRRYPVSW